MENQANFEDCHQPGELLEEKESELPQRFHTFESQMPQRGSDDSLSLADSEGPLPAEKPVNQPQPVVEGNGGYQNQFPTPYGYRPRKHSELSSTASDSYEVECRDDQ